MSPKNKVKETIKLNGKDVMREKHITKYLEDTKRLLIVINKLENEQRIIKKNLKKAKDEKKQLDHWYMNEG